MKNGLLTILILLFVLPALTPWLPHGAVHALHDHQAKHHGAENHGHGHEGHNHGDENSQQTEIHHPIHFDATTYFTEYLHVDLQNPEQAVLKAPAFDSHDIDYPPVAVFNIMPRYELASVQNRAPPDTRRLRPDKTPLYLSTQRLRI